MEHARLSFTGVAEEDIQALENAANLSAEQRIKILEVWMAKIIPLIMGYVTKDGKNVDGVIRRIASLELWVKIGVGGGGIMGFINTFGLADPIKKFLVFLLTGH